MSSVLRASALSAALAMLWAIFPAQRLGAEALWSHPVVLFSTADGYVSHPTLVADPAGDVHLLFMFSEGKTPDPRATGALMYARLHDGRWSSPLDVLVSPHGGGVSGPAVTLDEQGLLHVAWQGGALNEIYYSRAHVSRAGWAQGWSRVQMLSEDASGPSSFSAPAAIAASPDGSLHTVYMSPEGNLRHRRSDDRGQSWTSAFTIIDTERTASVSGQPRIAADAAGRLHVSWTDFRAPTGWPPLGTFYSRSLDRGDTWSKPQRVASGEYGLLNVIAAETDVLHRVWHGTVADSGERRHQWSNDGGQSWSPSQLISSRLKGGFTGYSAMGFDSTGIIHLVTSVLGQSGKTEDVYHLSWDGAAWSEPEFVSKGVVGRRSVEQPWLAISRGSQIHVVYEDDFERIWYTSRLLHTPTLPSRQIPLPVPTPTPRLPSPTTIPTALPALRPTLTAQESAASAPTRQSLSPLLAGIIPGLLLLGVLIGLRTVRRWKL